MNEKYVICIRKSGYHTTIGKRYHITLNDESTIRNKFDIYDIINDLGVKHLIWQDDLDFAFVDVGEHRKNKLKRLLK